jgi:hypothetical protein
MPFRSGHVLSLRRFPASRDTTVDPEQGCSWYFGREIERNVVAPIHIEWLGPAEFLIVVRGELSWEVTLAETAASRVMNTADRLLPRKLVAEAPLQRGSPWGPAG